MASKTVHSSLPKRIFVPHKVSSYNEATLCVTIDDKVSVSLSHNGTVRLHHGVVRFIGSIEGKPGDSCFYGIELTRSIGKNDGKHNKIEYFRCGKKKGIFVKRNRIKCVETPNSGAPRVTLGDTVSVLGKYKCKGVIKYIGVPCFKRLQGGNWYGIELETGASKSNGVYHEIKYFEAKQDHAILVASKMIKVCDETHCNIKEEKTAQIEDDDDGIRVQHIRSSSGSWPRPQSGGGGGRNRAMTIDSSKQKKKKKHKSKRRRHHKHGRSMDSTQITLKNIGELEEEKAEEEERIYDKVWIIRDYGYPISFLLSDKKANICILKQQIIHTFGHCEVLSNQQIQIKNVDKMCLLVRIHFHRAKSFEKATQWKFWWKKKSVAMKKHAFKKWKQCIQMKEVYPIEFVMKKK
eukprot:290467_1